MVEAIKLFGMIVEAAIPYAITFAIGNYIVVTFLQMGFKGEVRL